MTLLLHIGAGAVGLVSGTVALFAAKGGALHRRSGMVFFYSMLTMALSGAGIAIVIGEESTVLAGFLAAYLVITARTTVRPLPPAWRWLHPAATLLGVAVAIGGTAIAAQMIANGESARDDAPAPMFILFSLIALLSLMGDLRVRSRALAGAARLRRHLWRMCFALFLGTGSFFLGQADEFPEALRIEPLLLIAALFPLVLMMWWLRRVKRTAPATTGRHFT